MISRIANLREIKMMRRTSPNSRTRCSDHLIQMGITMWFDTMVANAREATITIDVAEEKPPIKANIASASCSKLSGSDRTNKSGFDPLGKIFKPATAIGITNSDISIKYAGKAQDAVCKCPSSAFSTTRTWNIRGKQRNAAPDKNVSAIQRFPLTSHVATFDVSISFRTGPIPPSTPQTTKTPTATKAHSLTTASTAIAMTTPWWRSLTSRFRVPNKIVKSASPAPSHNAAVLSESDSELANAPNDSVTDCSCNAM